MVRRSEEARSLPAELEAALDALARTSRLLVGCDYDGTLAPIVEDPSQAHPVSEAIAALRMLTGLPNTTVAVVSGRALRDLAALSRLPAEVHLVGSHGSEFDLGFIHSLDHDQSRLLEHVRSSLAGLVMGVPGATLEIKPAAIAVHMRRTPPKAARELLERVNAYADAVPGIHRKSGKKVIELSVVQADKGLALEVLRRNHTPTATLFFGDDVTDEAVFEHLAGSDVGVKVGRGRTTAAYRVTDPHEVVLALARLQEKRHSWFAGGNALPIQDHSLLSDGSVLALVSPVGSVTWLCHPGPDGPALFASLLGDASNGHFTVAPRHGMPPLSQAYLPGTMTLRTRFADLTVLDHVGAPHPDGADEVARSLFRVLIIGTPTEVVFAPRPDFGQAPVALEIVPAGLVAYGGSAPFALRSPGVDWQLRTVHHWQEAVAVIEPTDEPVVLELRLGTRQIDEAAAPGLRADQERSSREWLRGLQLPAVATDAVARSALTLRALQHNASGGILAAATLGLPEWIGGQRNWDYRYVWLRDASICASALLAVGSTDEADALIRWLSERFRSDPGPEHVRPLYPADGSSLQVEAELTALPGYAGSRPVLVGNAAQSQAQLDVFGAVARLVGDRARIRGSLTDEELDLVSAAVSAVSARWREPDHGIWEIRDVPRHHTHSKMMSWVAVDAAIEALALRGGARPEWHELRERIAADVLKNGWDPGLGSFISAYDRREIDAAVLQPLSYGFPATREQVAGTVRAVESRLRRGAGVYRYRFADGLPGDEGAMHICAAWLIGAYLEAGAEEDARELLDAMVAATGRTGLLPEMVDPVTRRGLGNHPQGYSHAGLILAAVAMDRVSGDRHTDS